MSNKISKFSDDSSDIINEGIWNKQDLEKVEKEEMIVKPNQWGQIGAKTFKAFTITHQRLPKGCYSITADNRDDTPIFTGKYIKIDKIIRFKNGFTDKLLNEINDFWNREKMASSLH